MNTHTTQSTLSFILLIAAALSAGCGPVTAAPSPTETAVPSPTLARTTTPSPTDTPEPLLPTGTILYPDIHRIYSVDLPTQAIRVIYETSLIITNAMLLDGKLYITTESKAGEVPYLAEMLRLDPDGTSVERLASSTEKFSSFSFQAVSPNNEHILFYSSRSLSIIDTKTKLIRSIPEASGHRLFLRGWSSDSSAIFFFEATYTSSGWRPRRLLEYSIGDNKFDVLLSRFPDPNYSLDMERPYDAALWSPDQSRVLLNLSTYDVVQSRLYIYNPTDHGLASTGLPGRASTAIWLKDGTRILMNIWGKDQPGIFMLDTKSLKLEQVKENEFIYNFSWSPDHQKLAIFTRQDEQTYLYLFDDANFKLTSQVDIGYLQNPGTIVWHPDNEMILYEQSEPSLSENGYLYFLELGEPTPKKLQTIKGLEIETRVIEYVWWYDPTWSPDGKFFAYLTMTSTETDWAQDFILNIQSANAEGILQIKIPREGPIDDLFWIEASK